MKFLIILLISCIYAQDSVSLTSLQSSARLVQNIPCSSQIIMTLNEAQEVYSSQGLSKDFLDALQDVKTVAGDIPLADSFRSLLDSSIQDFTKLEDTINFNTSVLKTGPGLPEGFGQTSNSLKSSNVFQTLFVFYIINFF